jgi:hypothetical protein
MSKKKRQNITPFGERIIKVLKDNGLVKRNGDPNYSKAERECDFRGSFLSKAVRSDGMHEENAKKFQRRFNVNSRWLETGIGDTYVKNGTPGRKTEQLDITENPIVQGFIKEVDLLKELNAFLKADNDRLKKENDDLRNKKG